VATHFGAAAGAIGWIIAEWIHDGKPSVLGGISGSVAGLVAITPASGFVKPFPALLIGLLAGFICYTMVVRVKRKFGYDDSLDAFGVHGVGGTVGALLTGVFATNLVNNGLKNAAGQPAPLGWVDGNVAQIGNQAVGCLVAIGLGIVGTLIALKVSDVLIGVRVDNRQEVAGLDVSLHGEEGYNFDL
jgi:ammonium transporter, Amt family